MEAVDAIGLAGGLIVLWKNFVNVRVIDKCSRFIEIEILEEKDNLRWSCLLVYGEPDSNLRNRFYEDILVKIKSIGNPLICIGD